MPSPLPSPDGSNEPALYIVSTPIGNLEDITLRALRILKEVGLVAAEDTRHTRKLLTHFEISTRLLALHEHNESERAGQVIDRIRSGESVALVTDAGTPCVSDPGYRLVSLAAAEGVRVVPVPGASALLSALAAGGLPTDAFHFQGFLPKKKGKRHEILERLSQMAHTFVVYESPHRIVSLLEEMQEMLGARSAVLARELTKRHEEFLRGDLKSIALALKSRERVRGECTLMVAGGAEERGAGALDLEAEVDRALKEGGESPSRLSKRLAQELGVPRSRVYELVLKRKGG
ncbi:MAG: 16S rRNA (cytidine(1402)-2'-O)-methyltransferase [Desulfobacterales bacterium]|nr:16S rRNA (cytidine(1402)-2'-O)-methyltransferase [Desulfobacterales bacterium]